MCPIKDELELQDKKIFEVNMLDATGSDNEFKWFIVRPLMDQIVLFKYFVEILGKASPQHTLGNYTF